MDIVEAKKIVDSVSRKTADGSVTSFSLRDVAEAVNLYQRRKAVEEAKELSDDAQAVFNEIADMRQAMIVLKNQSEGIISRQKQALKAGAKLAHDIAKREGIRDWLGSDGKMLNGQKMAKKMPRLSKADVVKAVSIYNEKIVPAVNDYLTANGGNLTDEQKSIVDEFNRKASELNNKINSSRHLFTNWL